MKTLGIYQFIRNATKFDFPLEESILSAIPVADQIVICECYSDDDTFDRVMSLKEKFPRKITVIQHEWMKHHTDLAHIGNFCIPHLSTDWHFQLQADEVIHEKDYDTILHLINNCHNDYTAIRVQYNHFLGNYETTWPFCYTKAIRIARKGSGWWLSGDACQLDGGDERKILDCGVTLFHYGKVKNPEAGFAKETDFQSYYKDLGFPDPKLEEMKKTIGEEVDYVYLFESAIEEGKIKKFIDTHPKVMESRIKEFKDKGYEQFVSKVKEGLKTL